MPTLVVPFLLGTLSLVNGGRTHYCNLTSAVAVHLASLSEVATMRSQSKDEFRIIFENDKSVEFSLGADSGTKANLGILTVTDVYDEHYFIGYPLTQGETEVI